MQRRTLHRHTRTRPRAGEAPREDPQRIGRYTVRRRLGVGGMSIVYDAHDERLDRRVALKLLLLDDGEQDRIRLLREAQALARLSHPNVVEVFEIGEHEGKAFVAMELVEGHTLDRWLRLRRRTLREAVALFVQAGEGLAAAHEQGLVHRDFKPSNVLVGSDGRVRVVDFGLVRESTTDASSQEAPSEAPPEARSEARSDSGPGPHSGQSSPSSPSSPAWNRTLTRTGTMVGTPAYMSPEQLARVPPGPASDQFSFCIALYEAVYGRHPFVQDDDWKQLPRNVLEGRLVRPGKEHHRVPTAFFRVLARGLEVRPEARWSSMHELLVQLQRALEPRRLGLGALALGAGLLATAAWLLLPLVETSEGSRCDEAAAIMRAAWSSQARDELRAAWRSSRLPNAVDTWERAEARLTVHIDDWWEIHQQACEAESPMVSTAVCLQRQAEALEAHLDVIGTPDETLLHNLVPMIDALPRAERCGTPRPPHQDETNDEDPPWRKQLDRIDASLGAGHHDAAAKQVETLVARLGGERPPRLAAELALRIGQLQHARGELDAAARSYEDAYLGAKPLGLDELSASAALKLLRLHGETRYRAAEAERWTGHARAEVERLGDPMLTAQFLNSAGRALRSRDDLEGALEHHRRALALQRQHLPAQSAEIAASLFQIGSCLGLLGREQEGLDALEESLAMYQATLGSSHPYVAGPLTNIGAFLVSTGQDDAALRTFEQVLRIHHQVHPDNPLYSRFSYINMALIHERQGRPQRAALILREYLERYQQSVGNEDYDEGQVERLTCWVLVLDKELDAALPHCKRALAVTEHELGPDHTQVNNVLANMAQISASQRRLDEALAYWERVFDSQRRSGNERNAAHSQWEIGRVHWVRGDLAAARAALEQARARLDPAQPYSALIRLETEVLLAAVLLEAGETEPALTLARAAAEGLRARQGADHRSLVRPLAVRANAECTAGDPQQGRLDAQQAITLAQATDTDDGIDAAWARFVLARCLAATDRSRALGLARQAAEQLAAHGELARHEHERVQAWLEARGERRRGDALP